MAVEANVRDHGTRPWHQFNSADERGLMELEGVVHNGIIVPDDAAALAEGTRVRIIVADVEKPKSFGERFAQFKGAAPGLATDLAQQHDHYRLGTPKR